MAWTSWQEVAGWDFEGVIYEKKYHTEMEGGVARITMNRPERMNALNQKVTQGIIAAFADASKDPMIGVVIITGAGDRAFTVGGDVETMVEGGFGQGLEYWTRLSPDTGVRLCRKPVIARVNGYAIGAGNHLAYHCDFTIAADHAIFGQNGPRICSPADAGLVSYLVYTVGMKKARELWMLCRRYTAQEALEMGLINKVTPFDKLDEEVDKWCEDILRGAPACIEILKRTFDAIMDTGLPRIVISNSMYSGYQQTPEAKEGPAAFLEKRPPNFWKIKKAQLEARAKEAI